MQRLGFFNLPQSRLGPVIFKVYKFIYDIKIGVVPIVLSPKLSGHEEEGSNI